METRKSDLAGFSLVEVVLSLGVIAFAIIAIIGLLSMSLRVGKEANEDTLLPMMAVRIIDSMRSVAYRDLDRDFPGGKQVFFDSRGIETTNSAEQIYQCEVQWPPDPPSPGEDLSGRMRRAVLAFTWPKGSTNQSFVMPVSFVEMGDTP